MDFQLLQDPISKKWVSLSPGRENRPDENDGKTLICPFCPGSEKENPSIFVIANGVKQSQEDLPAGKVGIASSHSAGTGQAQAPRNDNSDWQVRVINNKFPFAPVHEVIIHSPNHHESFGELPLEQVQLILKTYRHRYNAHKEKGQVCIFTNSGVAAGESLPHPHSQLVVMPSEVTIEALAWDIPTEMMVDAGMFHIGCPRASQWPDEVWFIPKDTGKTFGEISDAEITSLADSLDRLIRIFAHRDGHEFPYNLSIRPGLDWYLRFIPRMKNLGGFEVGSGVYVNTHDPKETVGFLKQHWENPDFEKIKTSGMASYRKGV